MTSSGVNHHVDVRNKEGVLGTSLVEVGEIDASSPFPILFSYYDNIGEPVRVLNLTD